MSTTQRTQRGAGRRLHQRQPGFTLVELLVVIGILAVMAAVLLPVFFSVKERGREKVCLSNLRQIGMAFQMYREDYGDARPPWLFHLVPSPDYS